MMNYKIVMTAGYPEMAQAIKELASELKLAVTVAEGGDSVSY